MPSGGLLASPLIVFKPPLCEDQCTMPCTVFALFCATMYTIFFFHIAMHFLYHTLHTLAKRNLPFSRGVVVVVGQISAFLSEKCHLTQAHKCEAEVTGRCVTLRGVCTAMSCSLSTELSSTTMAVCHRFGADILRRDTLSI